MFCSNCHFWNRWVREKLLRQKLKSEFEENNIPTQVISVDGWLSHPHIRFATQDKGLNFYQNGIDLNRLKYDATYSEYHKINTYKITDKLVVILEGIFLFRKDLVSLYDYTIWIEATEETCVQREIERIQEGTPESLTIRNFNSVYFPAQRYHRAIDRPKESAD